MPKNYNKKNAKRNIKRSIQRSNKRSNKRSIQRSNKRSIKRSNKRSIKRSNKRSNKRSIKRSNKNLRKKSRGSIKNSKKRGRYIMRNKSMRGGADTSDKVLKTSFLFDDTLENVTEAENSSLSAKIYADMQKYQPNEDMGMGVDVDETTREPKEFPNADYIEENMKDVKCVHFDVDGTLTKQGSRLYNDSNKGYIRANWGSDDRIISLLIFLVELKKTGKYLFINSRNVYNSINKLLEGLEEHIKKHTAAQQVLDMFTKTGLKINEPFFIRKLFSGIFSAGERYSVDGTIEKNDDMEGIAKSIWAKYKVAYMYMMEQLIDGKDVEDKIKGPVFYSYQLENNGTLNPTDKKTNKKYMFLNETGTEFIQYEQGKTMLQTEIDEEIEKVAANVPTEASSNTTAEPAAVAGLTTKAHATAPGGCGVSVTVN